jgi:hypothetical protein
MVLVPQWPLDGRVSSLFWQNTFSYQRVGEEEAGPARLICLLRGHHDLSKGKAMLLTRWCGSHGVGVSSQPTSKSKALDIFVTSQEHFLPHFCAISLINIIFTFNGI